MQPNNNPSDDNLSPNNDITTTDPSPPLVQPVENPTPLQQQTAITQTPTQPVTETASFQASLPPIQDEPEEKKKHSGIGILFAIIAVVLVGVGGYFVYANMNGGDTPITPLINSVAPTQPLQEITAMTTVFSKPDTWTAQQAGSVNIFGSPELDGTGYPVAILNVGEDENANPDLVNATKDTYLAYRGSFTPAPEGERDFQSRMISTEIACRGQTREVKPDTYTTDTTTGLVIVTTKKPCESGERIAKKRITISTDGRLRSIEVEATTGEWTKNSATLEKVLASIDRVE